MNVYLTTNAVLSSDDVQLSQTKLITIGASVGSRYVILKENYSVKFVDITCFRHRQNSQSLYKQLSIH